MNRLPRNIERTMTSLTAVGAIAAAALTGCSSESSAQGPLKLCSTTVAEGNYQADERLYEGAPAVAEHKAMFADLSEVPEGTSLQMFWGRQGDAYNNPTQPETITKGLKQYGVVAQVLRANVTFGAQLVVPESTGLCGERPPITFIQQLPTEPGGSYEDRQNAGAVNLWRRER